MEETTTNGIRKEVSTSAISVDKVYESEYQKEGTLTAQIRQTVTTKSYYPSKSVTNDHQDNIFSSAEFNFEESEYENVENRVAWIDVPVGSTKESVQAKLESFPEATLYKVLSNKPIITDSQNYAIGQGLTNIDVFANRQAVRFPEGHESEGELALDPSGKVQYRAVFFMSTSKEDQDKRTTEPSESYLSDELKAELQSIGASEVVDQQAVM